MSVLNIKNVPVDLYRRLKRRAEADHRSMAQEVIVLLSEALSQKAESLYRTTPEKKHSVLEMRGLGSEIWKDVDVEKYIEEERRSWG